MATNSQIQTVIVFSDFEPDDIGCLVILLNAMQEKKVAVSAIVVGEGNKSVLYQKYAIAQMLLDCYPDLNIPLLISNETGYKWYFTFAKNQDLLPSFEKSYGNELILKFIQESSFDAIVCLMSHQILIDLATELEKIDKLDMLKSKTLFSYGSFNFRRVAKENRLKLVKALQVFREIHLIESHYLFNSQVNSINELKFPNVFKPHDSLKNKQAFEIWRITMNLWNPLIFNSRKDALEKLLPPRSIGLPKEIDANMEIAYEQAHQKLKDENKPQDLEKLERTWKIYQAAHPKNGFQTVLADYMVALAVLNLLKDSTKGNAYFDEKSDYTQFSDSVCTHPDSSVLVNMYNNLELDSAVEMLSQLM